MQYVRASLLTLACVAILSSAAMADSMSGQKTTPTDPMSGGSSQGMGSPTGGESITGEILSVQGEMYTVKDSTGKEVQLHVDDSTQKSGKLKEGDQIEAQITPDGHVLKVKKAEGMN
jgi:hypothetical protein